MSIDFEAVLGPHLTGYEPRPSQERMAHAVRQTLEYGGRLIVEAGTGTGKSLAYLIPLCDSALSNENRVVVSTFTKALQRQLVEKDLPFIKRFIFPNLTFALCLGSDNYLCLRRMDKAAEYGLFPEEGEELRKLLAWAKTTKHGIREDTPWELWRSVSREADLCHGRDCRHYMSCLYQKAKERERRSHLLVVNHHLYFANLSTGGRVLPPFEAAVFDEAHEVEDVAADYMGAEVSNFQVAHILNGILSPRGKGLLGRLKWLEPSTFSNLATYVDIARSSSTEFFQRVGRAIEYKTLRIRRPGFTEDTLSEPIVRLMRELEGIRDSVPRKSGNGSTEELSGDLKDLDAMARRCGAAAASVKAILGQELEDHVYWAERGGRSVRLSATPVDVAGMDVFQNLEAAVFTSATLSTGGTFQYIQERLGLIDAGTMKFESHFDYPRQAAIYIGRDLPDPRNPAYEERVVERITDMLVHSGGRTLVLFTSYAMLNRAADHVEKKGTVHVLRQGDAESYLLVERFREDPHAALFGTYTFWQGIDVPGEALQCVIITKLPFAVPDEPVVQARMEALQARGIDSFSHYQVPRAALMLKQGFGRLIRSNTDRGVVAILDPRVATRGYGKDFLRSLPGCGVYYDFNRVLNGGFLDSSMTDTGQ